MLPYCFRTAVLFSRFLRIPPIAVCFVVVVAVTVLERLSSSYSLTFGDFLVPTSPRSSTVVK